MNSKFIFFAKMFIFSFMLIAVIITNRDFIEYTYKYYTETLPEIKAGCLQETSQVVPDSLMYSNCVSREKIKHENQRAVGN